MLSSIRHIHDISRCQEEREKGEVRLFEEIMTENFSNLMKNLLTNSRSSVNSKYENPKRFIPRQILTRLSMAKDKGKILSSKTETSHEVQGVPSKIHSHFLIRNNESQRAVWGYIQSAGRKRLLTQSILQNLSLAKSSLAKLSFENEGQIKMCTNKQS